MVSFTFIICAEPYKYEAMDTVINLVEAIIKKGHKIIGIFFYGSGIYNSGTMTMINMTTMKIRIEVDCTPEEARGFLGLPDVRALQEHMMAEVQAKFAQSMSMMDPETVMNKWVPASMQGMEALSKLMWETAAEAMGSKRGARGEPEGGDG